MSKSRREEVGNGGAGHREQESWNRNAREFELRELDSRDSAFSNSEPMDLHFLESELNELELRSFEGRGSGSRAADLRGADPRNSELRNFEPRTSDPRDSDLRTSDLRTPAFRTPDPRTSDPRTSDLRTPDPGTPAPRTSDPRTSEPRISDLWLSGHSPQSPSSPPEISTLLSLLKRHFGYDALLDDQIPAIELVLNGQDSLVVLPTGAGKSMCYQLPALALPGTAVVVSPLLALMKDQVDGLLESGVSAAALNSTQSSDEQWQVIQRLRQGELKLLYLSPERLAQSNLADLFGAQLLSFFAIDEAHCISQWGHEFRPDYRALNRLRRDFPNTPIHAFTATATPQVQEDIVTALQLERPAVLVGNIDRPNLVYRALHRRDLQAQVVEVIERHRDAAGIVYCNTRKEVESICERLVQRGYRAVHYHAGLGADERQRNQEAFLREEADIVVATIAFGMGIDRPDVRFVIHTGMPKTLEGYQQEAGRAGRDRQRAECVLLYNSADRAQWLSRLGVAEDLHDRNMRRKIYDMYAFCRSFVCRHKQLVEYFGQEYGDESCGSCDNCRGEHAPLEDSLTMARKILSCVARLRERFGAAYVAQVLRGSNEARILKNGHNTLSTWGLLSNHSNADIGDWLDQLVAQGFLEREPEYGTLRFTPSGLLLLKGEGKVLLTKPSKKEAVRQERRRRTKEELDLDPMEHGIFEKLREIRRDLARERNVPPYVIFGDVTLRQLAKYRPSSRAGFLKIYGVGEQKAELYGEKFLRALRRYSEEAQLEMGG